MNGEPPIENVYESNMSQLCDELRTAKAEIERLKNHIAEQAKCLVGHPHLIYKPEDDDGSA